jgi:hypothetical protein
MEYRFKEVINLRTKILNNRNKISVYQTINFPTHLSVTVYTEDQKPVNFSSQKEEEEFHQELRNQSIRWFPEDSTEI